MIDGRSGAVLRRVQRLFGVGSAAGATEGQLLERYLVHHDEVAFEALVARHGPMVLGVCRRVLRDPRDVEDAFQATFLILVRRARSIRNRELLGNWLYGVAQRVSLKARARPSRVGTVENLTHLEDHRSLFEAEDRELRGVLDEELGRLPEKYRAPLVLCYLEGHTHEEAATRLGWPVGTVRGRLARGRETLRGRLARRGLAPASSALTAVLTRDARASVPESLVMTTVRDALHGAAGPVAAAGAVSAAGLLAESVLGTLTMAKVKVLAAGFLAAGLVTGTAVIAARQGDSNELARQPALSVAAAPQDKGPPEAPSGKDSPSAELPTKVEAISEKKAAPPPPPPPSTTPVPRPKPTTVDADQLLKQTRVSIDAAVAALDTEVQTLSTRLEKARADLNRLRALQSAFDTGQEDPAPPPEDQEPQALGAVEPIGRTASLAVDDSVPEPVPAPDSGGETLIPSPGSVPVAEPVPTPEQGAPVRGDESPHTIQAGDLLQVEVLEALPARPITGLRRVREDGTISLDWYGDLKVAGLTRRGAKVAVVNHMRKYLRDEALGLTPQEPGKGFVDPADSDRVFVNDNPVLSPNEGKPASVTDTEQRLHRLETLMERLLKQLEKAGNPVAPPVPAQ
jgi:RNA polymerase sigma factor (sigma-70 family)